MTIRGLRLPATLTVSLLAALTTWVSLLTWTGFSERPSGFLVPLFFACLLVAVLGRVAEHDKPALSRMMHSASSAMAVSLGVADWSRSGGDVDLEHGTGWLKAHGWKAVAAGPRDPLPTVWQELGRSARVTGRRLVAPAPEVGG